MKTSILLFVIILSGCANRKTDIVEQQKKIKDEITRADLKAYLFQQDAKAVKDPAHATVFRLADSVRAYEYKKASLKSQLDSLETELNKY